MITVFSNEWFKLHQDKLLKFANSRLGRFVFKVNKKKHLKGKIFTEIHPNALVWEVGEKDGRIKYAAEVLLYDYYADSLYQSFKPAWFTLHFLDWLSDTVDSPRLQVDFGFHTLILRSNPGENYPSDGMVAREADPEESLATIVAGNGNDTFQSSGGLILGYLEGYDAGDPDTYYLMMRGQMAFDLGMLFQGCEVTSSYLEVYNTYAVYEETESTTPGYTDIVLVNANMADPSKMSFADYENMGSTHLSDDDITESSYVKNAWYDFNMNAAGLAMLNSNLGGTAEFGTRLKYDVDGPQGGKPDLRLEPPNFLGITQFICESAESGGSIGSPHLHITYTKPVPTLEEGVYVLNRMINNKFFTVPGESIGVVDTIDSRLILKQLIEENIGIQDNLANIPNKLLPTIEQFIGIADIESSLKGLLSRISSTITAVDAKVATPIQEEVESVSIADTVSLIRVQVNTENISVSDDIDFESFFGKTISQSISIESGIAGTESYLKRTTGITPVWILKVNFATETLYLSDYIFSCDSLDGGITTKAWIKEWSPIYEDISGKIGEVKISDLNVQIIYDRDYGNNIHELLWNFNEDVESISCELFVWVKELEGDDAPVSKVWSGTIYNYAQTNEQLYNMQMIDHSVRFNKKIGNLLGRAEYPNIDPDDVGKMAPIIYGDVKDSPALAIDAGSVTTLATALTTTATSVTVTDATYFPSSGVIQIEGEQISFSGRSGNTLTSCVRGYSSTAPTTHAVGMQLGTVQSEYWYLLADHPVKSIGEVYVDGVRQTGSDFVKYTNHSGKAKVKFTTRPVLEKSVDIEVDDNIKVRDFSVTQVAHIHNVSSVATIEQVPITTLPKTFNGGYGWNTFYIDFSSISGTVIEQTRSISFTVWSGVGTFYLDNNLIVNPSTYTYSIGVSSSNSIQLRFWSAYSNPYVSVSTASRNYRYWADTQESSKTGQVAKASAIKSKITTSKDYYVALTGNSSADTVIGTKVTADIQGYEDTTGDITGTPNTLIERPDHVIKHFLNTYADISLDDFYTDTATFFASKGYKFAGVLNKRKYISTWLKAFAWQCRSYFKYSAGKPQLLWRADTPVSSLSITDDSIRAENNRKMIKGPKPSPMSELLNVFDIQYDRDWTKEGDGAYKGLLKEPATPATDPSVIRYGQKSNTELSTFDFVVDETMAQDLLTFYRDKYKDRKKVFEVEVFLDLFNLAFGQTVNLVQEETTLCEIQAVNIAPGNSMANRIDKVKLKLKEV